MSAHVCGLSGYNPIIDPPCSGADVFDEPERDTRPTIPVSNAELVQALLRTNELLIEMRDEMRELKDEFKKLNFAQLATEGRDITHEERLAALEEWRGTFAA